MDYYPAEEDEHGIEHPSVGRSAKDNREIQGNDTGRSCFPHAEQYHLQQDTKRDRQAVRFQGALDLSLCEAYERHDRAFIQRCTH